MSENLSKIQEIDEKGIGRNDAFWDKILEDYKRYSEMVKSFSSGEEKIPFSSDVDKFKADCLEFISYIRQCVGSDETSVLYMIRRGNSIHYGRYDYGIKIDKSVIDMISDEDLRRLYELVQNEFSEEFVDGCSHTFGEGWSLKPLIGENVMLDIKSDSHSDRNWFFEETHKALKDDSQKKKLN